MTLGQLAQMTSGYVDYVERARGWSTALYAGPVPAVDARGADRHACRKPLYVRARHQLELRPHQLRDPRPGPGEDHREADGGADAGEGARPARAHEHDRHRGTPAIPEPALHAFTSERRQALRIPSGTPFYEESTYWNPSWTITRGAIQTTNIYDLSDDGVAIGTGKLLSPESYEAMISTGPAGEDDGGARLPDLLRPERSATRYGLGIVKTGDWLVQDPHVLR